MFDWLLNRRRKQAVELLSAVTAQLEESLQLNRQALALCAEWARIVDSQGAQLAEALALCAEWARIVDSQGAQLAEAQAENRRLWAALSAPKELQQYMAAGCSEAQAKELALAPRRSTT